MPFSQNRFPAPIKPGPCFCGTCFGVPPASGAPHPAPQRRSAPGTGARSSVHGRSPPIKSGTGFAGVLPVRLADGTGKAVGRGRHQDRARGSASGNTPNTPRRLCGSAPPRGRREGINPLARRTPARGDCPAASRDAESRERSGGQGATYNLRIAEARSHQLRHAPPRRLVGPDTLRTAPMDEL